MGGCQAGARAEFSADFVADDPDNNDIAFGKTRAVGGEDTALLCESRTVVGACEDDDGTVFPAIARHRMDWRDRKRYSDGFGKEDRGFPHDRLLLGW